MVCWTIDRLEPKTCAILIPSRAAGGGASPCRRLFWSSANAVTIHPAAGGGQVPRQPARLKSAPPEGSAAPGRFFMRPAVGVRGSFALSGVIEFAGFTSLSYPVWFNSRRPHHIPYPVTGTTKRMMVFYTLSPHHRELRASPSRPHLVGGSGRL